MNTHKRFELVSGRIDAHGDILSKECLEKIATQAPGLSVLLNFDQTVPPLGKITKAQVKGDRVEAEVELFEFVEHSMKTNHFRVYIVPGMAILSSTQTEEGRLIEDVWLLEASLTTTPTDSHISPLSDIVLNHEDTLE